MVISSQRTIYGVHLSLAKQLGLKYHVKPNTTLNEKYKILEIKPIRKIKRNGVLTNTFISSYCVK